MKLSSTLFHFLLILHRINPFKRAFCKLLKLLNFPNEKIYKDINFYGKFKVNLGEKNFYLYHFGDTISKHIFWKGLFKTWENDTGWIWKELCEVANTIFDVGANTGVYSLVAKTINKDAQVFAFEPSIDTFKNSKIIKLIIMILFVKKLHYQINQKIKSFMILLFEIRLLHL